MNHRRDPGQRPERDREPGREPEESRDPDREAERGREPEANRESRENREPGQGREPERDMGRHGNAPEVRRGSEQARQAGDRAFGPPPRGPQWPGREPSEAERDGVPATDTQARTPLGVGTSTTRRGERIGATEPEPGRRRMGLRGRSRRPHGKSEPEHDTGVGRQEPVDEESPHLPTGDQAG